MKLLRKVPTIEIKRCFVVGNLCAARSHKGHMKHVESPEHFSKRVEQIRKKVLTMPEKSLDKIIGHEYMKRLIAYNSSTWHLALVSTSEVGVWTRAGELPLRWTNRSLAETATKVKRALSRRHSFKHPHIRATHAIPGILRTSVNVIQDELYLLPIAFKGDTGTRGRCRLKSKMTGDIDDGCMRAIALAVSGKREILVYFGKPKNESWHSTNFN